MPPIFAPREAEDMTMRLRHDLRAGHQLHAARQLDELLKRLEPRIEKYARAAFAGHNETLVEEAIAEIYLLVCQRLGETGPKQVHWERRFNQCFQRTAIDAQRNVRRRNGLDHLGRILDKESEMSVLEETIPDTRADKALEHVLGKVLMEQILARVPDRRYVAALRLHVLEGMTWPEVAVHLKVSEKTARNYYDRAIAIIRDYVSVNDWAGE